MKLTKQSIIVLAPLISFGFYFLLLWLGLAAKPATAAAITLLTVIWWVSEAIPIPATSLVPFALLPIFGVVDHKTVASSLGSHVILLLMGAFMLSKAIEKSGVHQRLAVYMVRLVGVSSGRRLVFGFMLASGLLSMWISNTATTLIMLPIALAILAHIDNRELKVALILGIAYAASVGGIGTPIGTPPNVIFMGIYEEHTGREFGFLSWMKIGVPIVLIALPIMAWWLTRNIKLEQEIKLPDQGQWRSEETRTLWVFGLTALAWITRKEPFGGWSDWLNIPIAGDSTVALFAVVLMFLIPNGKGSRLLDWDTAKTIPWGMLLLFAGGIAIAKGFVASGLSQILGDWFSSLANLPIIVMILTICLVVTYLTEIISNTATATLLMPILAVVASSAGYDPMVLMIPAAMCASCAFMLPVATAPNAIAFGTGELEIKDMVKEGAILSFIMSCLIAIVCFLFLF
ncbi:MULTISPECIES: SLC13 family permease [unclassified Colwellia]|uniref:SLC13 family permease n=1 Tax=unclassified Colwellia TaxID=196834 RepID=UPI0015F696CF|nr:MULTISPECIES: SLC13 family permease [unclassified Colwellia]MBA6231941.1 SLC13/DASS family transporter [Colwellia sp. MB02u-7]MBA6235886.1 SLC13/DASS family transporter [Colwellia sp. MB02u-11]MBA6255278.1 SLC13/DASS family transporter [Colwellia sp. MB3u-28]MBA6258557.1 SLC13/DASS family transporter [Colwellia sp. MB3u-41]MBA6298699.1 SLC13/DASS family transporter [Colwellia sp. MB3u-22]